MSFARRDLSVRPAPGEVAALTFGPCLGAAVFGFVVLIGYGALLDTAQLSVSPLALAAVLLAATLSSIAGFAFSAMCGVVLLHLLPDAVMAVQVMMVCSIANQALSVTLLWRNIDWRMTARFVAGGVMGLPLGVWLLLHLQHSGLREIFGALVAGYAAYVLLVRPPLLRRSNLLADLGIGALGGVTGGIAGFPSAPVTIWCGIRGWDKQRQRGIYQPFILVMQVLGLSTIALMRSSFTSHIALPLHTLPYVPMAMLGTWSGLRIFRALSDRAFARALNMLLLASGIGLML